MFLRRGAVASVREPPRDPRMPGRWSMSRSDGIGTCSRILLFAHVLVGEPVPTPDQVGGRLSPEHALSCGHPSAIATAPWLEITTGGIVMTAGIFRRAFGCGVTLAALMIAVLAPRAAQAQAPYPSRIIKLVVGFAAGGGNDIIARIVAQKMQEDFHETVIVENRVGAGGRLAAEYVKNAAPDGYTLLIGASGAMTVIPAISVKPPYH